VRVANICGALDSKAVVVAVNARPVCSLKTVGYNANGQLGDGTTTDQSIPSRLASGIVGVSGGERNTLFVGTGGTLWATGENSYGELGDGTATNRHSPVQISLPAELASDVVCVSAKSQHTMILKTDGTLWATGRNDKGQLGDGTKTNRSTPIQVASGVGSFSVGSLHSLYVKTDGTLWAMGSNSSGQLGDGTMIDRQFPVQIASGVAAVAAGDHTLFIKTDSTLWATGGNLQGQLGDGTTTSRWVPVRIASDVVHVSVGSLHTQFVKTDGTLWATGFNFYGQLGDGTTVDRRIPVQVSNGVASVSAGGYHTLFVKTDGTFWSTGSNQYHQLGDGTTINRSTPVQVASGVSGVSAGTSHSLLLFPEPMITAQPQDRTIVAGEMATLSVAATGVDLSYQWYEGSCGTTTSPIDGAIKPIFITPALNAMTHYWVRVTNTGSYADSNAATVIVLTALESWRLGHFGTSANSGQAADAVDADGDGMINLLEYATGSDPLGCADVAPVVPGIVADGSGNYLTLSFHRIADAALIYTVEGSPNLTDWDPTPVWTSAGANNVAGLVVVRDVAMISDNGRRFLRLKVSY
jgi:alpha-tubulin suppressor-like RCC1 family protein